MRSKYVNVEGFGKVYLENQGEYYSASDENGNPLGEVYPDEVEDWDESDEVIMGNCLADLIDDGYLEKPNITLAFNEDY